MEDGALEQLWHFHSSMRALCPALCCVKKPFVIEETLARTVALSFLGGMARSGAAAGRTLLTQLLGRLLEVNAMMKEAHTYLPLTVTHCRKVRSSAVVCV